MYKICIFKIIYLLRYKHTGGCTSKDQLHSFNITRKGYHIYVYIFVHGIISYHAYYYLLGHTYSAGCTDNRAN